MEYQLCNLTVKKGQKINGFLQMPFTDEALPTTIIYGKEEGETVLITGGIHNAEYVGIECVTGLARDLRPEDVKGILILVNIVNINGFRARTVSVSKEDGKNLNRVFPGNPEGTFTDKLAYFMEKELFSRADYYIDVHNGDWFEDLTPYIYCAGNAKPEVAAKAEAMAKEADVRFYIKSNGSTGAYNYAGIIGVPSVLLERGGKGIWTSEEVQASQKDVRNILRCLGVLTTPKEMQYRIPNYMSHAHYLDSHSEGCWFPARDAGDTVMKGELIGYLKDYFGNIIEEIRMDEDGVILYQTISYSVPKGSPLVAYGHYGECIEGRIHE
ncbi:MAG: succinylglutamate desuccinylase/aspartoacylase family protein [Clostridiales bacterium]|nr:succinylglutamate desuccinylase/aspartoacylase family protein [Clostridiales bacterium]